MLSPEREGRLTASLHGTALGLGYDSAPKAWRKWRGEEDFSEEAKTRMQWGVENEYKAIAAFEAETGELVDCCGDRQLWVPYHDWSGCTPDGLVGDLALVEAKCPSRLWDSPSVNYWCQVQSQLAITNRVTGFLCAWTPDGYRIWATTRDDNYWPQAEPELKKYLEMLRAPDPPKRWKKPTLEFHPRWTPIC